jgi:hemerythrin superfamily protein
MPNQNAEADAIKLLTADHRTVEGLFEDFEKAKGASRKEKLVHQICTELKIHSMIEEEIFYPALRGKIEEDMLDEATVEHDGAKVLINDLELAEPNEDYYDAKVKVLQEQIEHHVGEEEKQRDSMFAQAKKSGVDLKELGRRLAERKAELTEQAKTAGLPPAVPQAVGA